MMPFVAVRCLNCNNIDEFPRMDYDEIPYCSQCSSTSNLVPATPPSSKQQTPWTPINNNDDDLASLFSRGLSLADTPITPPTSPPSANFSVSQHYTHPTTFRPPTPQQPAAASAPLSRTDQERAYIQYILASNLGSDASSNDLEIALAHGIIDRAEYERAVALNSQLRSQQQQQQMYGSAVPGGVGGGMALDENCGAHAMMDALAAQRKQHQPLVNEYANDYYGGVDRSWEDEDEAAPCSVYAAGARLRPFDL